jgi:hypothetical protein
MKQLVSLALLFAAAVQGETSWNKTIDIDPNDVAASLSPNGIKTTGYLNYYT